MLGVSLPAVSKHLRVLERAGLITRSRDAQWRPCRIAPAPLKEVAVWAEGFRALWEQRFDRLEHYLHALQTTSPPPKPPATPTKEIRHARKTRRQ